MAAQIRSALPAAQIELVRGSGGVFIVDVDGARLWDKRKMGNEFPAEDAIVAQLRARP